MVDRLIETLVAAFPHVPESYVRGCVQDAVAMFVDAPIRTYLPILVARRARTALTAFRPADSLADLPVGAAPAADDLAGPAAG